MPAMKDYVESTGNNGWSVVRFVESIVWAPAPTLDGARAGPGSGAFRARAFCIDHLQWFQWWAAFSKWLCDFHTESTADHPIETGEFQSGKRLNGICLRIDSVHFLVGDAESSQTVLNRFTQLICLVGVLTMDRSPPGGGRGWQFSNDPNDLLTNNP